MSKGSGGTRTKSANSQQVTGGGNSGTSVTASAVRKQLVSLVGEPRTDAERNSLEKLTNGSAEKQINYATVLESRNRNIISAVGNYLIGDNSHIRVDYPKDEELKVLRDSGVKSFVAQQGFNPNEKSNSSLSDRVSLERSNNESLSRVRQQAAKFGFDVSYKNVLLETSKNNAPLHNTSEMMLFVYTKRKK